MLARIALSLALAVSACGTVDTKSAPVGRFDGSLYVMWVGEGSSSGDGKFVYVPNPAKPLTFYRMDANGKPLATLGTIVPDMMYTDGGSVPRLAQVFKGFNPWGYAPAYMMHDWLFDAHHCNTKGSPSPRERTVAGMTFDESAEVMAEAINTLKAEHKVEENDVAEALIPRAVKGPISKALWENGTCREPRVDRSDEEEANAAFPGEAQRQLLRVGRKPAQIIAEISF